MTRKHAADTPDARYLERVVRWADCQLAEPNVQRPNGRMSHDIAAETLSTARDELRAMRTWRARACRFVRSYCVMDLRDSIDTRKARAERYARKNKTCGRRAVFAVSP